jgi:phage terminase small subunit
MNIDTEAPRGLGAAGKKEWARFTAAYKFEDLTDRVLLETYCVNIDILVCYRKRIKAEGPVVACRAGVKPHPLLAAVDRIESAQIRLLKLLLPSPAKPHRKVGRPEGWSPRPRLA